MKKLLEEYRRKFGEFEAIDVVDTEAIARMRERLDIDAPLSVHWAWNYGAEAEEFRNLYEKGKVNQWNAELDLDWDIPVSKDEWVVNPELSLLAQICKLMGRDEATQKAAAYDELNYSLAQLLHGEQGALQICGQLVNACETMDEKWFASSQVIDEARHIEALAKFMERKMDTIYPISGTIKTILDGMLAAPTPAMKTLGMQTLFEGVAMGIFGMMRQAGINPLFTELIRRIELDEARHAAFGVLTMRRVVARASEQEMHEMEDWAFTLLEALNAGNQIEPLRELGPKYDLDPENITAMITSDPTFPEFNSLMYMHTVVPNLKRLGLVTERTEAGYRHAGILSDVRVDQALEQLGEQALN